MSECRALYIHLPFCRAKCAYCDFNSYAGQEHLIPTYVDALLLEATLWVTSSSVDEVETLYFGGGTPSLVPNTDAARLIDGLRRLFDVAGDAEVTLEANPESVDEARLRAIRQLGVNRLSLGIQSFDDAELRFLGRIHDAARAEAAYRAAREAGFDSVSIDLIFGLPGQTVARWRKSLEKAVELGPDHLSLYALTVEEATPLGRRIVSGDCREPDADTQADMYAWSAERLAVAGYEQYEISNWAKAGHRCRHNLTYWHAEPFLGLGAGAHSYVDGYRLANVRPPAEYTRLVEARGALLCAPTLPWVESREEPDADREASDAVILGLRLTDGVSLDALSERFGINVAGRYVEQIADLRRLGLLESVDGRIRLTERGHLLGNEAFEKFLPG